VVRKDICDSRNSILWKKSLRKGSVIAEIPSCEIKVCEEASW
jgi:hypothetical protein